MKVNFLKIILIAFIFCMNIAFFVYAEARAPGLVVIDFVKAIQNNDVVNLEKVVDLEKIKNQPRHSYSIEELRRLFGSLDVEKIECSKPVYDGQTKTIRIRMNQPISFDFELKHQNLDKPIRGVNKRIGSDFYKIISIHP